MSDQPAYRIAVGGVALGLVAFLIGAAIVLATGHNVATEYWTTGSAISGALLGLLAPTPTAPLHTKAKVATRAATQASLHAKAARLAHTAAEKDGAVGFELEEKAHLEAAKASSEAAGATALTSLLPLLILVGVFAAALVTGIEHNSTQLQALAAAAGGALIGLIAPSPGTPEPSK